MSTTPGILHGSAKRYKPVRELSRENQGASTKQDNKKSPDQKISSGKKLVYLYMCVHFSLIGVVTVVLGRNESKITVLSTSYRLKRLVKPYNIISLQKEMWPQQKKQVDMIKQCYRKLQALIKENLLLKQKHSSLRQLKYHFQVFYKENSLFKFISCTQFDLQICHNTSVIGNIRKKDLFIIMLCPSSLCIIGTAAVISVVCVQSS